MRTSSYITNHRPTPTRVKGAYVRNQITCIYTDTLAQMTKLPTPSGSSRTKRLHLQNTKVDRLHKKTHNPKSEMRFLKLPYIENRTTAAIHVIRIKKFNIQMEHTNTSLRKFLSRNNTTNSFVGGTLPNCFINDVKTYSKAYVVYEVISSKCGTFYMWIITWKLHIRIKEYMHTDISVEKKMKEVIIPGF